MPSRNHKTPSRCHDPCAKDCNTCYRPEKQCSHDCGKLVNERIIATKQARTNFYWMQQQLASALKETVPRYARRPKSTPGKGHGCGSPPRRTLPPLWMYSLGTQRPPHPPVHRDIRHRKTDYYGQRRSQPKLPFNQADEIGTHRYYLPS